MEFRFFYSNFQHTIRYLCKSQQIGGSHLSYRDWNLFLRSFMYS